MLRSALSLRSVLFDVLRKMLRALPPHVAAYFHGRLQSLRIRFLRIQTPRNIRAMDAIVNERCSATRSASVDPLSALPLAEFPLVELCAVAGARSGWDLGGLVQGVLSLEYPRAQLRILLAPPLLSGAALQSLDQRVHELRAAGFAVALAPSGQGRLHMHANAAVSQGSADFCLVVSADWCPNPDALRHVMAIAISDTPRVASWELRQAPREQRKFYDPVTGLTNWSSHSCVLLRRSAWAAVGGYDEKLPFEVGDAELSYRFRQAGFLLRYCPTAVASQLTHDETGEDALRSLRDQSFANLYIRLKFGTPLALAAVPAFGLGWVVAALIVQGPSHARSVAQSLGRLLRAAPDAWLWRRSSPAHFPFRFRQYDLLRNGLFQTAPPSPATCPLVSVITRTHRGRDLYLRQAMRSVAHQTWPHVEHIIVEDGGDAMREVVEEAAATGAHTVRYIANGKHGRSNAGNRGLAMAAGRWCMFLDDDDLLFADHVEVLASTLLTCPQAVASYSLAWEVITDARQIEAGHYTEVAHVVPGANRREFDSRVLRHYNFLPIQAVLFERDLYQERGGFDEDLSAYEDWVLWNKYAAGNCFKYVPVVTSLYRTPVDPGRVHRRATDFVQALPVAEARIALHHQNFGDAR